MPRNPEQSRPERQFIALPQIQDGEGNVVRDAKLTRKPSKHTVRASMLELDPTLYSRKTPETIPAEKKLKKLINMSPKERARVQGKTKKATPVKPSVSERKHVNESTVATVIPEEVELSEQREGEVIYESSEEGLRAIIPGMEDTPDPLATVSVEEIVARRHGRRPEEKPDWADYGSTKQDHKS